MFVRAYLRASTKEQDANRARTDLEAFTAERGLVIAATYLENESGASLQRPELFRLLADSHPGDVLLVEQVDRLSRLNAADWERLRAEIRQRQVKVVALDLPTSWQLASANSDDFTSRTAEAINGMLLDMLAAIARKDYEDRRKRQAQGIQVARGSIPDGPRIRSGTKPSCPRCALARAGTLSFGPRDVHVQRFLGWPKG
jgi:DNA invertase Pin-like site-specific DNA recombinase